MEQEGFNDRSNNHPAMQSRFDGMDEVPQCREVS